MARLPRLPELSWAQCELLGELRAGPQWEGGLRKQTFRALYRRGLVESVERGELLYKWKLTADGARVVLRLGPKPLPWWARRPIGARPVSAEERVG